MSEFDLGAFIITALVVIIQMGSPYAREGTLRRVFRSYTDHEVYGVMSYFMEKAAYYSFFLLVGLLGYWLIRAIFWVAHSVGSYFSWQWLVTVSGSVVYGAVTWAVVMGCLYLKVRCMNAARTKRSGAWQPDDPGTVQGMVASSSPASINSATTHAASAITDTERSAAMNAPSRRIPRTRIIIETDRTVGESLDDLIRRLGGTTDK